MPCTFHSTNRVMSIFARAVGILVCVGVFAAVPLAAEQPPQPKQQDEFVPMSEVPPEDQLPAAPLLIAAYAFVWVAVLAYVISVARRLGAVQGELTRLEATLKETDRV